MAVSNSKRNQRTRRLTVEQAARLYSTTPEKVRRRARRGGLESEERDGRLLIFVDPERDTLTSPQAARLLGVGSPTIRRDVASGRLSAKRDGRDYRIPLASLVADRRCPQDARDLLDPDGRDARIEEAPRSTGRVLGSSAGRARVHVHALIRLPAAEALDAATERYGSRTAAVEAALLQVGETLPLEAELRRRDAELDDRDKRLERAREEARVAKERAARLPAELYCHRCDQWVPLEQLEQEDSRELGGLAWIHRHEGLAAVVQGREAPLGRRKYG
jgi:excisionase family DNA binding protein